MKKLPLTHPPLLLVTVVTVMVGLALFVAVIRMYGVATHRDEMRSDSAEFSCDNRGEIIVTFDAQHRDNAHEIIISNGAGVAATFSEIPGVYVLSVPRGQERTYADRFRAVEGIISSSINGCNITTQRGSQRP